MTFDGAGPLLLIAPAAALHALFLADLEAPDDDRPVGWMGRTQGPIPPFYEQLEKVEKLCQIPMTIGNLFTTLGADPDDACGASLAIRADGRSKAIVATIDYRGEPDDRWKVPLAILEESISYATFVTPVPDPVQFRWHQAQMCLAATMYYRAMGPHAVMGSLGAKDLWRWAERSNVPALLARWQAREAARPDLYILFVGCRWLRQRFDVRRLYDASRNCWQLTLDGGRSYDGLPVR